MAPNVERVLDALDGVDALGGTFASPAASRVAGDLSDPWQRFAGDDRLPHADDDCWRCGRLDGSENTGLCRPCRLYLAEVRDGDPRAPFDPNRLADEILQANQAIMASLRDRFPEASQAGVPT